MLCVFDLDGVVIDSLELVKESYRRAGVDPPDDIFAREGVDWVTPEVKLRKDQFYLRGLTTVLLLPGFAAARQLRVLGHDVRCLSGAPVGSLNRLRPRFNRWWPFSSLSLDGTRTPAKMEILKVWGEGVYVDDQVRLVDIPVGWRFVHYTGQDAGDLVKEMIE